MLRKLCLILAFSTIVFSILSSQVLNVKAQEPLQLQVNVDKEAYDPGEIIRISGRISLSDGSPVENALVSIQVTGPDGGTYHIALVYSDGMGEFYDEYRTQQEVPNGLYKVYVKASKIGFKDVQGQIQYSVIPEFSSPSLLLGVLILAVLAFYTVKAGRFRDRRGL
ncbi:MAG: MG2 domain-containing protein [Candidatus Bathyarchaeia archaeon]